MTLAVSDRRSQSPSGVVLDQGEPHWVTASLERGQTGEKENPTLVNLSHWKWGGGVFLTSWGLVPSLQ